MVGPALMSYCWGMRVRRNDSSPKLQLSPPPGPTAGAASSPTGLVSSGGQRDGVSYDAPNPLTGLVGSSPPAESRFGLPGLTHPKIKLSDETNAALLQMAQEDPALYGRVVQHLNALDRKKSWSLRLDAKDLGNITEAQDRSFRAQLDENLGPKGLGTNPETATYFKGLIQYEAVEKTKLVSEAKTGNSEAVEKMLQDVQAWNAKLASSFEFEHDVGGAVKNPEVSTAAITELMQILKEHEELLTGARIELEGHTSTVGADAYNLALSNERAATIMGLLEQELAGTELEGRVRLGSLGHGEAHPVDRSGQRLALGSDGRPVDGSLEDPSRSRRVEVKITPDPLIVEAEPGQSVSWKEAFGVLLEIKASPSTGGANEHPRRQPEHHVTKSRISKQIGGEIPCPHWMKKLLGQ